MRYVAVTCFLICIGIMLSSDATAETNLSPSTKVKIGYAISATEQQLAIRKAESRFQQDQYVAIALDGRAHFASTLIAGRPLSDHRTAIGLHLQTSPGTNLIHTGPFLGDSMVPAFFSIFDVRARSTPRVPTARGARKGDVTYLDEWTVSCGSIPYATTVFCDTSGLNANSIGHNVFGATLESYPCCGPHVLSVSFDGGPFMNNPGGVDGTVNCNQEGYNGQPYTTAVCSFPWDGNYDTTHTMVVQDVYQNGNIFTTTYSQPIYLHLYSRRGGASIQPAVPVPCAPPPARFVGNPFAGDPVSVLNGELFEVFPDFKMSGPFGITFQRTYRSKSTYSGILGVGWRTRYEPNLDLTLAQLGVVAYFDCEGDREDFVNVTSGNSSRNDVSADVLALSADGSTYTLTSFQGAKSTFDSAGRLLSLADRFGNVQTISRDPSTHKISTVTDPLGRQVVFSYDPSTGHLSSVTSVPSGITVSFSYTGCGTNNLCSVTEPNGKIWTYQYNDPTGAHDLSAIVDPLGNTVVSNTYATDANTSNYVHIQTRANGQSLQFTFDYQGGNTLVVDSASRSTVYTIDPGLNVVTNIAGPLCDCGGDQSHTVGYDQFLRPTSLTDGNGHTLTLQYTRDSVQNNPDGSTNTIQAYPGATIVTQQLSQTTSRTMQVAYYAVGDSRQDLPHVLTFQSVDTPGNQATVTDNFDAPGFLRSRIVAGYVGGVQKQYTTSASWDSKARLLQVTGQRTDVNQTTTFQYYPDNDSDLARRGQLMSETDPLNHITTLAGGSAPNNSYTLFGDPLSMADPNNVATLYSYRSDGRLKSSAIQGVTGDPTILTTSYTYDADGHLLSVTRPAGNGISYVFDASGRVTHIRTVDASGNLHDDLNLSYDSVDEPTSIQAHSCTAPAPSCPSWTVTRSEALAFDSFGRLQEIDHPVPSGSKVVYIYDPAGNVVGVQDEDHPSAMPSPNIKVYYDFADRQNQVSQLLSGTWINTSATFDVADNMRSFTDPNGNITTFAVDDFGRLRQQVSPVTGTTAFTYDPAGNMLTRNDANGAAITYTFDALNRPIQEIAARTGLTSETLTWGYDDPTSGHFGIGRLSSMTDPTGSTAFTYDRRGLVLGDSKDVVNNNLNLTFAYDANGNRRSITYPDGQVATYGFDWADRPATLSIGTQAVVQSANYKPGGPIASIAYGNATSQTLSYDLRYRPVENRFGSTGTFIPISDDSYAEDALGNITQIHDITNAAYNRDFSYDDIDRLTTSNSGASLWGTATGNGYTYDAMGNVKTLQLGTSRTASFSYSGTTPLLSSVIQNGVSAPVVNDAAGNELSVGTTTSSYSPRNLLSSEGGLSYVYDAFGTRTVTSGSFGSRYSIYNPENQLMEEADSSGQVRKTLHRPMTVALQSGSRTSVPSTRFDYLYFGGRPVAEISGGSLSFTTADFFGTPYLQTNSSASLTWRAEYEPYGSVFSLRSGDVHQPIRFPGQESQQFDTGANGQSDLSYNANRWYRPTWGRYDQPDPVGVTGGADPFTYAVDAPTTVVDPTGLDVFLAQHPVNFNLWGLAIDHPDSSFHVFLIIDPFNILRRLPGYRGPCITTISGEPAGKHHDLGIGTLNSEFGADMESEWDNMAQLLAPGGDEAAFENGLLNGAANYPNNTLNYFGVPAIADPFGPYYNSGGFISGLLESVGFDPRGIADNYPEKQPGFGDPVPTQDFRFPGDHSQPGWSPAPNCACQ